MRELMKELLGWHGFGRDFVKFETPYCWDSTTFISLAQVAFNV